MVSSRLVYAEAQAALAMARRMNRLDEEGLRSAVGGVEKRDLADPTPSREAFVSEAPEREAAGAETPAELHLHRGRAARI